MMMNEINPYERCPKHNLELPYLGTEEIDGIKKVLAVCVMPGCDYKTYVPLEEASEIMKRRVIRIDSVKEK